MTHDELFNKLTTVLEELFEIPPEKITLKTRLYEDLDLDSIDAVDLIVQLQTMTGQRIKPEEFKAAHTIEDVIICLERILKNETLYDK